ncbi:hypothetical protein BEL04_14575 [Mucilaginibacter sp. PPCGB 2223]|uniref:hypothetical protein n=1 Tax=Mucilaginibacter sp. PPCGB 2223 TaxID=1886027 RepID=UPI000824F28F|nr:hypothetical protein [Mucilaginibacter sp. PPCGB 2223]OCX52668.1 hypothetical protein BEL04_14575 [Mucilaginibacter sp. PPCGB 2223]
MKKILIITSLILGSLGFAKAQTDYCKDITKTVDSALNKIQYSSPYSYFYINRSVRTFGFFTNFIFQARNHTANYNAVGIIVQFTDGTYWKDLGVKVDCSYENSDVGYTFMAIESFFTPDIPEKFIDFKLKKIKKITLGNIDIDVSDADATKFMAYVNCIVAIKK